GRIHGPDEAMEAIAAARAAGFDELNIDLMFGLPGQSLEMAVQDVARVVALNPSHVSYYQLTLEPNTSFHHAPPTLPDEDLLMDIQQQGQQRLADAGYVQYEVSAYAREGHHCRHNLNYWQFGDYLGIGAGAHGKLSEPGSGTVTRRWRVKHPQAYLQHAGSGEAVAGSHRLDRDELLGEFMLNALRLNRGFSRALFEQRTGLPLDAAGELIEGAIARGLLERNGDDYRATLLGGRFLDDLVAMFFVSEEP
ncbi:MAG: oxygen-independent coproporphyrinogen III oxidase-like protein, partial [Gammaproteobacteria bacterium]|nr:oxygen-independent coproporphyrinogen III oxidase-like protein [Gammaproteobacteria bacterium]